jgi:hypothetical protein
MDEYPIKLGPILFTMVDPNPGHEVAYNRWYERDHFYAGCMIGPWLFAGSRWVAPRRLKDLRFPDDSPFAKPVDAGSYLSIYWELEGKGPEHGAWSGPQVWWLYGNGRGFDERTHRHTGLYDLNSVGYSDDDGVPIELALDHRYAGLGVVVVEPVAGKSRDELDDWLAAQAHPGLLAADGVDSVASFRAQVMPKREDGQGSPMSLGTDGGSPDRLVQLWFLEKEPSEVWDAFRAYAKAVDGGGVGRVTFAAPFIPTEVGTDRYTDELW